MGKTPIVLGFLGVIFLVAAWAMKFTSAGPLPAYNRYVLYAGIAATSLMVAVQAWRVATGRFVPTVHPAQE